MTTTPELGNSSGTTPPSTVLVTGGTGFLGAYIIRDLIKSGYRVKAIRRSNKLPSFLDPSVFAPVDWIDGDIQDVDGLLESMDKVDAVIHSAAVVSFSEDMRQLMLHTNIEGTANVVNAALEKKVKRFIHVSSVAAFGKKSGDEMVTEGRKWQENKLNTQYAVSKYFGEMEVWRGIAEGLDAVIVNPSTIIGYGDWNNSSAALFKNAFNQFPWYSNGSTGFVDVEDVSRAIVQLLATDIHSERFIVNGDNWSYRRLLDTIAEGFGKKKPHRKATPFLASLAWRAERFRAFFTGKKPLLSRETAMIAQSHTRYDNSKLLAALPGFHYTPIDQTIRAACQRYAATAV